MWRAPPVLAVTGASEPASHALPIALRGVSGPPASAIGTDSLAPVARLMATLSDAYGVSGHEGPVRAAVSAAIPAAWRGATHARGLGRRPDHRRRSGSRYRGVSSRISTRSAFRSHASATMGR